MARRLAWVSRVLLAALTGAGFACAEGSARPPSSNDDDDQGGAGGLGGAGGTGGLGGLGGAGGDGGMPPCSGTLSMQILWGAVPAPVVVSTGNTWLIGEATASSGPPGGAGVTYLATVPAGQYNPGRDDWVMLPPMDFSTLAGCTILLNVDLWRETETGIDGGNVQVTDADPPSGTSIWSVVGGYPGTMGYDATGLSTCNIGCVVQGQPVWTGATGASKKAAANLSEWAGKPSVTLRFAFHSDALNQLDGIYVGDILVSTN